MRKIIAFMHISLDGFAAGPNGEMNWIKVDEEIFDHVGQRISQGDTALYGRKTYELMEGYWPTAGQQPNASKHDIEHSKWYAGVHKAVISNSMKGKMIPNTTIISGDLAADISELKQRPGSDILLFGSSTATHALMQLGLLDGYWLFVNPVVLGQGIQFFDGIKDKVQLRLLSAHAFTCGVTALDYVVER